MHDTKNTSLKKTKNNTNNESHKENKYINKEYQISINPSEKKVGNQFDKNSNPLFLNIIRI